MNRFLQTDWNDGRTLCSIVRNLGGSAPAYDKIDVDPSMWEHNIQMGNYDMHLDHYSLLSYILYLNINLKNYFSSLIYIYKIKNFIYFSERY